VLLECLVYIGLWLLIVSFGFSLFYQAYTRSKRLVRSTDDLIQVLKAGESWRADLRSARGPVSVEGPHRLRIPRGDDAIQYAFTGSNVVRRASAAAPWVEVAGRVRSSAMQAEERRGVVAWRWEVELIPRDDSAPVRPVFTFLAVPESRSSDGSRVSNHSSP
jgi:hypothetical protein